MRREYVNAIMENGLPKAVGLPTIRRDLVEKRVARHPKYRFYNDEEVDVFIAYRDVSNWQKADT
jgi:hypothetical protein